MPWPLLPNSSRFCQRHAAGFVVVLPDAMVELARKAADHRLVAGVGPSKTAGGQSAEMLLRANHDDGLAHPLGLDSGRDRAGGAAIDQDVGLARRSGESDCQKGKYCKTHFDYLYYSIWAIERVYDFEW